MPNRQFDPVAAAAVSAVNASNRSLQTVQQQAGLPQLPAQAQAVQGVRNTVESLSNFSPANVLLANGGPSLPNLQGAPFPTPSGRGGPPSPQEVLPDQVAQALPFNTRRMPAPPTPSGGSGSGAGNKSSGDSASQNRGTTPGSEGSRDARARRAGR